MKKTNLLMLFAAPIVLMACGMGPNSSNSNGGEANSIPTEETIQEQDITTHFAKASAAMKNVEAIGVKVTGNAKLTNDMSQTYSYSDTTGTVTSSSLFEIKNLNIEGGIKNIKTTDIKAIDASVEATADFTLKQEVEGVEMDSNPNIDKKGSLSGKAYIDDGYFYVDLDGIRELITAIAPSTTLPTSMKEKIQLDEIEQGEEAIEINYSEMITSINNLCSSLNFIKGQNETYSYVFTLDPQKILQAFGGSDSSLASTNIEGTSSLYLSFTEAGFTSVGLLVDWTATANVTDSYYTVNNEVKINADIKANFLYGNDVKVKQVQDKDSYKDNTQLTVATEIA